MLTPYATNDENNCLTEENVYYFSIIERRVVVAVSMMSVKYELHYRYTAVLFRVRPLINKL